MRSPLQPAWWPVGRLGASAPSLPREEPGPNGPGSSSMAGHSRRVSNCWLRGRPESGREFRGAGSPAPIPDEDERRLLERMHVRAIPVLTAMLPEPPFRLPNRRVPSRGTHTPRYLSRVNLKYDVHCGTNRRSTVVTCARWSACEPEGFPFCQTKDGRCAARRLETEPRGWTGSRNRAILFG